MIMDIFEKVSGSRKKKSVRLYALSTCGWCKKTKKLLKELDVEYEYVDIDKLEGNAKEKARKQLKEYNPHMNLPTVVIDDGDEVIVGFKEDEIKGALE